MRIKVSDTNQVAWREINVKTHLPEKLSKLEEIAQNLWWVWNAEAMDMFRQIDSEAWQLSGSNPTLLLSILSYDKLVALSEDKAFMEKLNRIYADFQAYMQTPKDTTRPSVAYFSMEYGLTHVLKIYSGPIRGVGNF